MCNSAKKDFVAIAIEADALTRSGKVVPPDLKPIALDAVKRVNCRDAVQKALDAKNPRGAKLAFIKPLLDGWADRRLIADAEAASAQVEVLDKLKAAVASPGDGRSLGKLWTAEGFKVAGIPEAELYRAEATRWQDRVGAVDAFLSLYKGKATEQQLAESWQRVVAVGRHPDITHEHETRGELAAQRAPALARLARVPDSPSYANDTALVAAWGNGSALSGCAEANSYIARLNAARDRISKVTTLQRAIAAADAGTGTEAAVVEAAKPLARYDHPYAARVALGDKSVKVLAELKAALEQDPPSDRRIASVLDELRAANIELLARLDKIDPALAAEASAAGRRRKILNEFAEIDQKYPNADKQDQKWQTLWTKHKSLLLGRRDTEELRARLTLAVDRSKTWAALEKALDLRDMFRIRELYEQHVVQLREYPPLIARRSEVSELLTKADRIIGIQNNLAIADSVLSEDDLRFLRENHTAFGAKTKEAVVARVQTRLKTEARLVAGYPPIRVIPNGKLPTVAAAWTWAGHALVSQCLVAVDKARHLTNPDEAEQYGLLPCRVEDHTREGGGKRDRASPGRTRGVRHSVGGGRARMDDGSRPAVAPRPGRGGAIAVVVSVGDGSVRRTVLRHALRHRRQRTRRAGVQRARRDSDGRRTRIAAVGAEVPPVRTPDRDVEGTTGTRERAAPARSHQPSGRRIVGGSFGVPRKGHDGPRPLVLLPLAAPRGRRSGRGVAVVGCAGLGREVCARSREGAAERSTPRGLSD